MRLSALVVVLASAFLLAAATAAAEGVATDAARPADLAADPGYGIRVVTGGCPDPAAMSEEVRRLVGSQAYPGAPSAADLGFTGPRCEIDCGPCDWLESEPICEAEWVDTWNGGCNSSPEVFQTLTAAYGRITLCGTSGTYVSGGSSHRDTDWYEIQLDDATEITFCCAAEFPLQIILIDGNGGCPVSVYTIALAGACEEACIQQVVGPGTFWLWVGPSAFIGIPCGEEYMMTIDGYSAADCDVVCPGGGLPEGEPLCQLDYVDSWNGGCNSEPDVFQVLDPHAGTITVCGEAGVYPNTGMCFRDTDWYQITLDQPRAIEMCAYAEFPIWLFILGGSCDAYQSLAYTAANACELGCVSAALDPGTYWLWIGPAGWMPIDCGSRYTMTVTGYTTPVEPRSWGTIKSFYR